MTEVGVGELIYSLRKQIQNLQLEISALGEPVKDMPELISSANLLRSNEYLLKINEKKTQLLNVYEQYSKSLEDMLTIVFDIQKDLKNILKEQSDLISESKPIKKQKSRKVKK
jgi:hypothetical protein